MNKILKNKMADKLVNAFLKNKIISPLPQKITKKLTDADEFRKLCESKIKEPIIGFKAGGTGIPVMKKLKEKEPFYASIYKKNFLKIGKRVKINKSILGIELEVCYLIKKSFFSSKRIVNKKNITKFISHMAPCIEIVGYRQKKKGITSFGDLCSDFGANVKFIIEVFLPKKKSEREKILFEISKNDKTTIIFESPHRLKKLLNELKVFCGGERDFCTISASSTLLSSFFVGEII